MKRVLVAGATGYLGGFVARELKSRDYDVRALVRSPGRLEDQTELASEIVQADVTRPETLAGVCNGMDAVFSSVGITRQKDGLTFRDVDYKGNVNLLEEALRAGVRKFVYVSVFGGPHLTDLAIVRAHEDFVDELKSSGIDYAVIRPTGFFSDMEEILEMARKGRVFLVGSGLNRMNPIHGADLAVCCADALQEEDLDVDVGGPDVMTYRGIAAMAFQVLRRREKISSVPVWLVNTVVRGVRLFSRHQSELLAFFATAMTRDAVAPAHGVRHLQDHFVRIAGRAEAE